MCTKLLVDLLSDLSGMEDNIFTRLMTTYSQLEAVLNCPVKLPFGTQQLQSELLFK